MLTFLRILETCLEVYKLDLAKISSAPGLSFQAALKMAKVELDLLTDIDMLLMVKRALEEEYAMQFIAMWKAIISICEIMMKIKDHHILIIGT